MKIALEKNINIRDKTKKFLEDITEIPACPDVAREANFMLKNPKVSIVKLAKRIQRDHGLFSNILKFANSPDVGLPGRVYTIEHAIVILGINKIENIVAEASKNKATIYYDDDWYRNSFWRHSMIVANTSKVIAEDLQYRKPEHAFVAGLLHNIGILAIKQFFPGIFREIETLLELEDVSFTKAEEFTLGMNHAEIGMQLLNQWHYPKELSEAAGFHLNPSHSSEGRIISSIVHFADYITNTIGMSNNLWDKDLAIDEGIIPILNLSKDEIDEHSHFAFRDVLKNVLNLSEIGQQGIVIPKNY